MSLTPQRSQMSLALALEPAPPVSHQTLSPGSLAIDPALFRRLLSADDLAPILDLTPGSVRRATRDGRLPCIRISSRCLRYQLADVLQAIAR
jgi:hypothetical protein